ncbi:MAG: Gfo/Idh/MocA family oxidoreductase [Acidobacteriaceae bacterium]|nr:Gfo/Idh/MocA family oxidoreductase [Acidobacteriaceae bacterium]
MSDPRRELRVALLGQGFMGKAHSNAFAQVSRFFDVPFRLRLSVLCGRDQQALERSAAAWGWEQTATDWRQVVERPDIDLIDIALPNHLHSEAAIAAARAGKIVLCEKPLANTVKEAKAMVEAARNVPTMVWFNYRRVPAIAYAKRLIDEGRVGQVFHYRGTYQQQWGTDTNRPLTWKMDPEQAGHGVVGDLLSHAVDLALYLNGAIEQVTALTRTFAPGRAVEDAVESLATFANGSIGTLEATRFGVGSRNGNSFEVQGAKGMLRFHLEDMNKLEFFDATDGAPLQGVRSLLVTDAQHPYGTNFWRPGHIIGYEHTFIAALADFLFSLSRDEQFHPNFEDGLRVQEVLDAVLQSAHSRRWEGIPT